MSQFKRFVAFTVCLLYWNSDCVNGCRCFPRHPQEILCNADFAFVGKVLKEEKIPGPQPDPNDNSAIYKYTLRLIFAIKGTLGKIGSNVEIETAGNGALCGIRLEVGKRYLLSGRGKQETKRVLSCDLVLESKSVSFEQMVYFFTTCSYSYVRNCKQQNDSPYVLACKLPTDTTSRFCYFKTALCQYRHGKWSWVNADC